VIAPTIHHSPSTTSTARSASRGSHQRRGSSRTRGPADRSATPSATSIPSSASTSTTPITIFSGEIVVWNRVSAVSPSETPAGRSLNAPATSGRTSPLRVSTGFPSTSTVVLSGALTSDNVQLPGGSGSSPRSTPALLTFSVPAGVPVSRSPCSGSAAGSGASGTVDTTTLSPAARTAWQLVSTFSATGW
jgi:hypothetical protein